DDARRVVRQGTPDHRVQDLLPEVIGRSVLRVDLVVERETSKELLDGQQQVSFVVVILKLREDEAMAEPGERTQEECRRQPDGSAVHAPLRVSGDLCHPAARCPVLLQSRRYAGTATPGRKRVMPICR